MGEELMVAGIGCRSGVSGEQVEAAIDAAIAELCAREPAEAMTGRAQTQATSKAAAEKASKRAVASELRGTTAAGASTRGRAGVTAIATPAAKAEEPGIQAAAAAWGVPLLAISQEALEAANSATVTRSVHSMAAMNVHSVAEAAALAGATIRGMDPRLLQPRIIVGPVTCALADAITS